MKIGNLSVLLAGLWVWALAGCGGGGGSSSGSSGTGTLQVALVDAPNPEIKAAIVTITRVEANVNGEWKEITTVPKTFDLLDLVKEEAVLGAAPLPEGHYTQIRFFPDPAQSSITDGTGTHDVKLPSGEQTGIKVNVNYDIVPDQVTTVLLDFDAHNSFVLQGNGQYLMKPVVRGCVKVLTGTLIGKVVEETADGQAVEGATVTASNGMQTVTAQTVADGTFKLWGLFPGTYAIEVTYTAPDTTVKTASLSNVTVEANQTKDIGILVVKPASP